MSFLQYYSFVIYIIRVIGINAQVSLEIATDEVLLGKDIALTCTVHGIDTINRQTTRQWSMGKDDELLCYNGRINNRRKYKENVLAGNVFSLSIINVTNVDLKVLYKCRYGFDAASIFIEEDEPKSYLSLRLVTDFIIFGENIRLTCAVNGINTVESNVTRQWSMGNDDKLLSYNGRINNHNKYTETFLHGNAFSLKIFNVTESDVNITYRCRYGFDSATYFIKINKYNYVNPPSPKSTSIKYVLEKETDTIIILVYLMKVFPLPNCSLNIDASNFHITDLREHDIYMAVNFSLSLQRRIACNRSFNITCHVARKPYEVAYLKMKDECSSKGKIEAVIIISITSITIGLLIIGLVKSKRLASEKRKYQLKAKNSNLRNLKMEQPYESEV